MTKVKVKVCGITNLKDAQEAIDAGADALGFVFARSPRKISPADARLITRSIGPWVPTVGVFVNEKPDRILKLSQSCGLSAVQLHGDEPAKSLKKLGGLRVIKAFRVDEHFNQDEIDDFDAADAYLFDTKVETGFGGTGKSFDWRILDTAKIKKPFIISGGLNHSNVAWAAKFFSPYGVDVSSGVEKKPGLKDLELVKKFIENAKR